MGPVRFLRRHRHRRGFGVHSPFAFSLIRDVAGSPGHYYADDLLRESIGNPRGRLRRSARLLHRLVARLDPLTVVVAPGTAAELATAAAIARTDRSPVSRLPDGPLRDLMMVASTDWLNSHPGETRKVLSSPGCTLVAIRGELPTQSAALTARRAMPGGWALIDTGVAVFICSAKTPYVEYEVKLT